MLLEVVSAATIGCWYWVLCATAVVCVSKVEWETDNGKLLQKFRVGTRKGKIVGQDETRWIAHKGMGGGDLKEYPWDMML